MGVHKQLPRPAAARKQGQGPDKKIADVSKAHDAALREASDRARKSYLDGEWNRIRAELITKGENPQTLDRQMTTFTGMLKQIYTPRMALERGLADIEQTYGRKHGIKVQWEPKQ
ncbi:MAG: hypothetical protein NT067_05945 [Candidatus Diapherotrites archaeon]|nr:hypothetical protein [Candidatus Diapherotrites archaeon]